MRSRKTTGVNPDFRNLPSIDELMRSRLGRKIATDAGERHAAALARKAVNLARSAIGAKAKDEQSKKDVLDLVEKQFQTLWHQEQRRGVRRVINATGVIVHTNLGRASLSEAARRAIVDKASGYCTLEYDVETGKRGRRGGRAEDLIVELTGAEDALIVNNCAAAAYFILSIFAAGGEVIISRGELVEIGGDFRVPDVLTQTGAVLREVGTTNRTKLSDYEKAVGVSTKMILRVHPSNYRIVGFTAMPTVAELAALSKKRKVLFYEDIGSGALIDLAAYGLTGEPIVKESIANGADVVSFSGDKLLGGPQAGIIAGRRKIIEKLRRAPLYRALRADKLTYAALEATLAAHRRGTAVAEVPVLAMLATTAKDLERRAKQFVKQLTGTDIAFEIVRGRSAIGGGSAPTTELESPVIALKHPKLTATALEKKMRAADLPVIVRISEGRVFIDLRTVSANEETELAAIIKTL